MTVGEAVGASSVVQEPQQTQADKGCDTTNPMVDKLGEEILTAMHIIKDIRRLEKYQRDIILKVKESLAHFQVLLDHQLHEVAWSDQTLDFEETLLKYSSQKPANISKSEFAEAITKVAADKERLAHKFHEISQKSSLSEYVVNSQTVIDINSARMAIESIMKNEKPTPMRGDHMIPFDHTTFLANYCVASVASTLINTAKQMAVYATVPPPMIVNYPQQKNQMVNYDTKKMNGGLQNGGEVPMNPEIRMMKPGPLPGHQYIPGASSVPPPGVIPPFEGQHLPNTIDPAELTHEIMESGYERNLAEKGSRFNTISSVSDNHHQIDNSSDASSSTSEEIVNERGNKPLSFARITSLNLEKSMNHRHKGYKNYDHENDETELKAAQPIYETVPRGFGHYHGMTESKTAILSKLGKAPHYFFDVSIGEKFLGRVVIVTNPMVAPKMALNFHYLVTGEKGYGYKGCHFFQAWKGQSVICGDWEQNSGRGGRAAIEDGYLFTPDATKLPCIRGAVGMRRMSKKHSSQNEVASQFRIILSDMTNTFTGIFGQVTLNLEAVDEIASFGGEGGRPDKIAVIQNCGVIKN